MGLLVANEIVQRPSVSFTPVWKGTTTDPIYGTVTTNFGFYTRNNNMMTIQHTYRQSALGTAGSGTFLFEIPDGLNIDVIKLFASTANTEQDRMSGACGIFNLNNGAGGLRDGSPRPYDPRHLKFSLYESGTSIFEFASSTHANWQFATFGLSFTATVPILEWA